MVLKFAVRGKFAKKTSQKNEIRGGTRLKPDVMLTVNKLKDSQA